MRAFTEADNIRLFAAIGHIVVQFQRMELWVAEALSTLLGLNPLNDRDMVLASMSFRQKVDLLFTLYPIKAKNQTVENIQLVRKALYTAEEFRNRVVHSVWFTKEGIWTREKASLKSKNGFLIHTTPIVIDELELAAKSLKTITEWELVTSEQLQEALEHIKRCETST